MPGVRVLEFDISAWNGTSFPIYHELGVVEVQCWDLNEW